MALKFEGPGNWPFAALPLLQSAGIVLQPNFTKGRADSNLQILAVTALTSLSADDVRRLYNVPQSVTLEQHVVNMARHLLRFGCDGVIASPREIAAIRAEFPTKVLIVVPGIRMPGEPTDDHQRPGNPYDSVKAGADYLVVGRSIYNDPDPPGKVEDYVDKITRGIDDREA